LIFQNLRKQTKQNLALTGVMFSVLAFWVFTRVSNINPAILQDEFIYTYSSRRIGFWDQAPAYDFGNYLFNLVYSSTLVCGDAFYTCGKILNLVFFTGFVFTLFLVALRYIPFWWSLGLSAAIYLSPLSVYVSMYLPESLYFFLIALSVLIITFALESDSWKHWLIAGGFLGAAGLAKPHALISLMAIGLFVFIYSLGKRPVWKPMFVRGFSYLGGYLAVRVVLGFLLAGPKSLNVFGAYGASSGVGELVGSVATGNVDATDTLVGAGSVEGALGLFPTQMVTHTFTVIALLGASIAALLLVTLRVGLKRSASPREAFVLLVTIWLGVMVVAIVLFTGWITGSGDDHTTRVLLRYYDFMFPIVALASLAAAFDAKGTIAKPWQRWLAVAGPILIAGSAFGGYFANLTIQIADAPNLAGYVVDRFTVDTVSILGVLALVVLAFYPGLFRYALSGALAFTLMMTGYQAQDQYQFFRGPDSAADSAGKYVAENFSQSERDSMAVVAASRFDARVASLWMDSDNEIYFVSADATVPEEAERSGQGLFLVIGDFLPSQDAPLVYEGTGFSIFGYAEAESE